ncbi:hypothetical protein MTO96_028819 [Rhipicephalus appendiculatus]
MTGYDSDKAPTTVTKSRTSFEDTHLMLEGLYLHTVFTSENIRSALSYEPVEGDVFVVSYPKCGTTWLQHIAINVLSGGSLTPDDVERARKLNGGLERLEDTSPSDKLKNKDLSDCSSKGLAAKSLLSGQLVRKGVVGDWKNQFSSEQLERMKARIALKTRDSDVMTLWKDVDLPNQHHRPVRRKRRHHATLTSGIIRPARCRRTTANGPRPTAATTWPASVQRRRRPRAREASDPVPFNPEDALESLRPLPKNRRRGASRHLCWKRFVPSDAMKLRYRVRKRVFSILLVALSCAMVLLVAGISMYVVGWYDSVAVWLVSVGVAIELASCFLYCCNIHEKSRALLATVLLSEAEWDAPTPAEGGNGRVPNEDDGGDHAVPTCLTGDAYLDAIM